MSVSALLARLRALGVELQTDGVRLRWRPESAVGPELCNEILANKGTLISLLTAPGAPVVAGHTGASAGPANARVCPSCRRALDDKGRCWCCCDRACLFCGRSTSSAFIETCCSCGHAFNGNRGLPL
jgi:hypothetical protein